MNNLAIMTWPDAVVPRPAEIRECAESPRLYVYVCECCLDAVIVLDTHLERGPVVCRTCMECEE